MPKLSRREFLRGAAGAGAVLTLGRWLSLLAGTATPATALAAIPPHRVVHTHCNDATYWDYSTGWYGDYVVQAVVDSMTDQGVMTLTGTTTIADAWRAIIPAYTAGQKVAIKINLNNADCGDTDQVIDALPQPIVSVIRGLRAIGVAESDIYVYDVTNGWHVGEMPPRLVDKVVALYPNVQFHAATPGCYTAAGYSSTQNIHFNVPPGKPAISDRPICNTLVDASYLINMPIMKKHGMAGVTLAFKNHFGSFDRCDLVHWSVELGDGNYVSTYNGLVDIYSNTHIKDKTVLTIGDGLFGARIENYSEIPSTWPTFGNKSPNSLFFSIDPVAIDCVMYDILEAEGGVPAGSDDYLKLASAAGLGTFEHWDGSHQYHSIDYRRVEVASGTATATASSTSTATATGTDTPTATDTAAATHSPIATDTPAATDTPYTTATSTATETPGATETPSAAGTPTATDTATASPSATDTGTATPTPTPTATPDGGNRLYLPIVQNR